MTQKRTRGLQRMEHPSAQPRRRTAVESGQRLLVRHGSENTEEEVLAQVTSDDFGALVLSLPPGTYSIIEEAKGAPQTHAGEHRRGLPRHARCTCDAGVKALQGRRSLDLPHPMKGD